MPDEKSIVHERAKNIEKTITLKRAIIIEKPNTRKRVRVAEKPIVAPSESSCRRNSLCASEPSKLIRSEEIG